MKIALVGSAPSSVRAAPYGAPDWKIFACSPGVYGVAPRSDAWFELHRYEPGQPWFSEGYCDFLKNYEGPVYMAEEVTQIKNCTLLPVRDLVEKYGPYFFTSSLAYMFAVAIEEIEAAQAAGDDGPHMIGLWGVDMAATEEYGYQRAGCQYFAMIARAKGIEVGIPPESDLFRPPPLYGVSEISHAHIKMTMRRRELEERMNDAQLRLEAAQKELLFLQGAIDDLNWHQNTWIGDVGSITREFTEPPLVPVLQ